LFYSIINCIDIVSEVRFIIDLFLAGLPGQFMNWS